MTMRQTYSFYRLVNFIKLVIYLFLVAAFVMLFTKSFKNGEIINIRDFNNSLCLSSISTCSCEADLRGPNQSVVSFSLYGDLTDPAVSDRYIRPLRALTANISRIYPGNLGVIMKATYYLNQSKMFNDFRLDRQDLSQFFDGSRKRIKGNVEQFRQD